MLQNDPTSILLIDVDNLAVINEQHGREMGDRVIGMVVSATRRSLRAGDFLFRYGSDDFVALLLHTSPATGAAIGDRVREAVLLAQTPGLPRFGVSVVSVSAPLEGSTVEELVSTAMARIAEQRRRHNGHRSESIH
jgi:diguanylate cyclase (GGDEF)-like protein